MRHASGESGPLARTQQMQVSSRGHRIGEQAGLELFARCQGMPAELALYGRLPYNCCMSTAPKRASEKRPLRRDRVEARVTPQEKRMIRRAAALRGTTVSGLIVDCARDVLEGSPTPGASAFPAEALHAIVQALANPKPPSPALQTAIRRYRKELAAGRLEVE